MIIPVRFPFLISNISPELLSKSVDFAKALQTGALVLMDPEEARKELEDPLAQKAIDKALERFGRNYVPPRAQPVNLTTRAVKQGQPVAVQPRHAADREALARDGQLTDAEVLSEENDIDRSIIQLCLDLEANPDLRDDVFLELHGRDQDSYSREELGYIIRKCTTHSKIVQWAKNLLSEQYDDDGDVVELDARASLESSGRKSRKSRR